MKSRDDSLILRVGMSQGGVWRKTLVGGNQLQEIEHRGLAPFAIVTVNQIGHASIVNSGPRFFRHVTLQVTPSFSANPRFAPIKKLSLLYRRFFDTLANYSLELFAHAHLLTSTFNVFTGSKSQSLLLRTTPPRPITEHGSAVPPPISPQANCTLLGYVMEEVMIRPVLGWNIPSQSHPFAEMTHHAQSASGHQKYQRTTPFTASAQPCLDNIPLPSSHQAQKRRNDSQLQQQQSSRGITKVCRRNHQLHPHQPENQKRKDLKQLHQQQLCFPSKRVLFPSLSLVGERQRQDQKKAVTLSHFCANSMSSRDAQQTQQPALFLPLPSCPTSMPLTSTYCPPRALQQTNSQGSGSCSHLINSVPAVSTSGLPHSSPRFRHFLETPVVRRGKRISCSSPTASRSNDLGSSLRMFPELSHASNGPISFDTSSTHGPSSVNPGHDYLMNRVTGRTDGSLIARLRTFTVCGHLASNDAGVQIFSESHVPEWHQSHIAVGKDVLNSVPNPAPIEHVVHSHDTAFSPSPVYPHILSGYSTTTTAVAPITIEDSKPFKCALCAVTFSRRDNLKKHERATHLNERPFACGICSRAFQKKDHREKHVRIVHMGLRSYKCDRCPGKFGQRSDLNKHTATVHDKAKNYVCDICNRAFGHLGNKLRHMRVVHAKLKPFKCGFCAAAFGERSNLAKHTSSIHAGDVNSSL
jgi:Zinc finger, C2H2 type